MESKRVIKLSAYPQEKAIRAGEFSLMPSNPALPAIVSQPIQNFQQYTWIMGDDNGTPKYQQITPNYSTINLIEGTSFSFEVRAIDPSNVSDINNTSNLLFLWKRDDAPVFELNRLNGGVGTPAAMIESKDSNITLTGRYLCEVSNNYGSVESQAFTLNVIDPYKHPKLYKNLVINGDGEGGLQNWEGSEIKVNPFLNDVSITKGFGSFRMGNFSMLDQNKDVTGTPPVGFYFSLAGHGGLFYNHYKKRLDADPTFSSIDVLSKSRDVLSEFDRWVSEGIPPQIIPNEDFNQAPYAAFFPGIAWMDRYNKNTGSNLIGLQSEFKNHTPTYFTRDKIKFLKVGGLATARMSQVVDISEASELVDGNVYGVNQIVSQFFAYVGVGISNYTIKVQTTDGPKTLNYYVADSEEVYTRVVGSDNAAVTAPKDDDRAKKLKSPGHLYTLLPNTPIEVVPHCYDKTQITLEYVGANNSVLKVQEVNGPRERDIWAVKEKVFFPLTLYGLYEYINPSSTGNDITVFGQKYTNTNDIKVMFDRSNAQTELFLHPSKKTFTKATLKDVAARFLLNKWDFETWQNAYPGPIWFANNKRYKAANDFGAAAMFGVGADTVVPRGTRSIRISVAFDHTSPVITDNDPASKGWKSDYIYVDDFGNHNSTSIRTTEYGNPRCGITKIKLQLFPNKVEVSDKSLSYSIPPTQATVLGLQKQLYQDPSAFNTGDAEGFQYRILLPKQLPAADTQPDTLMTLKSYNTYINKVMEDASKASTQYPDGVPDEVIPTTDEITAQEDDHYTTGDFNQSLEISEDQIDPGME
jgi:hypothetical protein